MLFYKYLIKVTDTEISRDNHPRNSIQFKNQENFNKFAL